MPIVWIIDDYCGNVASFFPQWDPVLPFCFRFDFCWRCGDVIWFLEKEAYNILYTARPYFSLFLSTTHVFSIIQLCTSSGFSTEALPLLREALTAGLVSSLPNLDNDDYQARNMGIQGIHGTDLLTFSH